MEARYDVTTGKKLLVTTGQLAICQAFPCDECDDAIGPNQFELVTASFAGNNLCSGNCTDFEGTFICTKSGFCTWTSETFTACSMSWEYAISLFGGSIHVRLNNISFGGIEVEWQEPHDGDCLNWEDLDIAIDTVSGTFLSRCFGAGTASVSTVAA